MANLADVSDQAEALLERKDAMCHWIVTEEKTSLLHRSIWSEVGAL